MNSIDVVLGYLRDLVYRKLAARGDKERHKLSDRAAIVLVNDSLLFACEESPRFPGGCTSLIDRCLESMAELMTREANGECG
jgi:hypothetical protein